MYHLYSLEFLIQEIQIAIDQEVVKANITCGNLFNFSITYEFQNNLGGFQSDGTGKAIFFACSIDDLIDSFTNTFNITITNTAGNEIIGNAQIPMENNFADLVSKLDSNNQSIVIENSTNISNGDVNLGPISYKMCLALHGISLEIPINEFGSQLTVPLNFRKQAENWEPLFYSSKTHKSMLDPSLAIYAEMAGVHVEPPITTLLTPEYINQHLCKHKACPGARKFREFGLGPLAPPGSGMGTISTFKDFKPCGVYGMSQSYGTLDNYGAYGLFAKKPRKPKSCCGSPDCPYTIFYGKPVESILEIIGEDGPTPSLVEDYDQRVSIPRGSIPRGSIPRGSNPRESISRGSIPRGSVRRRSSQRQSYTEEKKCTCKQCKGSNNSKESSKSSGTCGSPSCPKKTPKPVKCPFLNKPTRLSAGADRNPNCPSYGRNNQYQPNYSNAPRRSYGQTEPCTPTTCTNPLYQQRTSETSDVVGACGGELCRFHKVPGTCPGIDTCPFIACLGPGQSRPVKPEPVEERRRSSQSKQKSCLDKTCDYYQEPDDIMVGEGEDEGLCGGKICPLDIPDAYGEERRRSSTNDRRRSSTNDRRRSSTNDRRRSSTNDRRLSSITEKRRSSIPKNKSCLDKTCEYYEEPEDDINITTEQENGDALCGGKICPLDRPSYGGYSDGNTNKATRLSLLIGEEGKKLLFGTDGGFEVSRDLLTTLSLGENTDIYYVISRLLADRQQSNSLTNYISSTSSPDFKTFDKVERKKQKRRGPCRKDSCKIFKYKTCSECGGLSRSGATCDNTDVSFSTISYDDSIINSSEQPQILPDIPKVEAKSALKKDTATEHTEKTVLIKKPKKKKTRFVYLGGEEYPGNKVGHKTCILPNKYNKNVPARMGWLWNAEKRKKTWRPGFLDKEIEERIIENRRAKGIPDPPEIKALVKKRVGGGGYDASDEEEEEEVVPKPTLIIQKKDGDYLITLHPLKDPKLLVERENPYMRCKPIQFIITKPKKPPAPPPIITRYAEINGEFEGEGEDYMPFYNDGCLCDEAENASSSSSDSELNIEFTTPAGIIIPERFKRPPNVVNVDTQFKDADFHCEDCPIIVPKKFKKDKRKKK